MLYMGFGFLTVEDVKFADRKTLSSCIIGAQMGYCFVEFVDQSTAAAALHKLNGKIIPNSQPTRR